MTTRVQSKMAAQSRPFPCLAALNADVRLTAGHDLGSAWFEARAA